jgi:hypothetical protein
MNQGKEEEKNGILIVRKGKKIVNRTSKFERKLQMRMKKEKKNQWHTPIGGLIPCKEISM